MPIELKKRSHRMSEDVSKVCRLCMDTLALNHTLEDSTTLNMVEDCLQITFTFAPPFLSAEMCDDCYNKIKDFYEFKETCRTIQDLLRQEIENDGAIKYEEESEEETVHKKVPEEPGDVSKEEEKVDDIRPGVKEAPIILNSSLSAQKHRSNRETEAVCDTIGEKEYVNVTLCPGRDNVIIVKKKTYHECNLCNRSFNDPYRLQLHILGHKKKRTYLCKFCPMSFPQNSSLQVHIRSHTKEKPFVCPHCGNAYGYYQLLKKHLTRYHAQESASSLNAGKQTVK